MHLFSEIFPLNTPAPLAAYTLVCDPDANTPRIRRALLTRLRRTFPGHWLWLQDRLITDNERTPIELAITLDILRDEDPDTFSALEAIEPDTAWQPTPQTIADIAIRTRLEDIKADMNAALARFNVTLPDMRIEREFKLGAWDVAGMPSVSISVAGRIVYDKDAQTFASTQTDSGVLVGLRVADKTSTFTGDIVAITGTVGKRREKLLKQARKDALVRLIERTPDDELSVRVVSGERRQEFPARALDILIRPADFALFAVDAATVNPLLRPDPPTRSEYIKALVQVAKDADIIASAYNSRENPALFIQPPNEEDEHFQPYLRFDKRRSRPYNPETLSYDFIQCGAFHLREKFRDAPIRVCVVNALAMKLEDFVEALQRQLTRTFAFKIDVIRERRVRVVSLPNLESAVRVVEKESPDIILAFVPDEHRDDDIPAYLKSLTLGRGIPAHVLTQSILDDPDSMPAVIMAILAKTGNTPFALAEPLEFTDFLVGLDVVRVSSETLTAIARVYRADGEFVRYAVRSVTLPAGTPPYPLMRDLFPQRDFAGKRIVVHYDGGIPEDVRQALTVWGQAIQARFATIDILRRGAPRLYCHDPQKKRVIAPPLRSAFRVSDHEAFFVLAADDDQPTPQPLHIIARGLHIEQALHTLQMWLLLYYGVTDTPKLPVTVYSAGELAYWLRKGGKFTTDADEVPFWL